MQLIPSQDICFFCAFRTTFSSQTPVAPRLIASRRSYNSSAPSRRPATAAARIQEDEPPSSPTREVEGWRCGCGHVNAVRRSECTICVTPRSKNASLVYKDTIPSAPPRHSQPPAPPNRNAQTRPVTPPSSLERREGVNRRPANPSQIAPTQDKSGPDSAQMSRHFYPEAAGPRITFHKDRYDSRPEVPQSPRNGYHEQRQDAALGDMARPQDGQKRQNWNLPMQEQSEGVRIRRYNVRTENPPNARASPQTNRSVSYDRGRFDSFFGKGLPNSARDAREPRDDRQRSDNRDSFTQRSSLQDLLGGRPHGGLQEHSRSQPRGASGFQDRSQPRRGNLNRIASFDRGGHQAPQQLSQTPGEASPDLEDNVDQDINDVISTDIQEGLGTFSHRRQKKGDAKLPDRRSRVYEIEEDNEAEATDVSRKSRKGGRRRREEYDEDDDERAIVSGHHSRRTREHESFQDDDFDLDDRSQTQQSSKTFWEKQEPSRPIIHIPEFISVQKLAQMLGVRLNTFLAQLEEEGFEDARHDHVLDAATSAMFADFHGFEPVMSDQSEMKDLVARPPPEDPTALPPRPPIVTIMGHVDHGKTTILDYLRKSSVVASEHGGITQHIGAFSVTMPGSERNITFLDTPGHAAFLEMRRRGANVTDIVVLVVAADDSVKPQTIEAIKHAREANVNIIVAINKVDKEEANVDLVKQDLARHEIVVEDYGGEYQSIAVSGKTGQGMSDLEDAIILLADVNDYRADIDGPVEGSVIESKVTSAGRVATVLVRRGTLKPGHCIVAGTTWARVRTLKNDVGGYLEEAGPGTPVQVDGWRGDDPDAGLEVLQAETEQQAKAVVELRQEKAETIRKMAEVASINANRTEEAEARAQTVEWEREQGYFERRPHRRPKDNEGWVANDASGPKRVHFVVKADVAGSTEALVAAIRGIGNQEAVANIIHSGTGQVSESDIKMLAATGEVGYAISFNQPVDNSARRLAEAAGLQILEHNIIYKVTDDVKDKVANELPPLITQKVLGEAEIGQIFEVSVKRKTKKIAGCRISNGIITRSAKVRVSRNGEVVFNGKSKNFLGRVCIRCELRLTRSRHAGLSQKCQEGRDRNAQGQRMRDGIRKLGRVRRRRPDPVHLGDQREASLVLI